jgi:adenylate cyclase
VVVVVPLHTFVFVDVVGFTALTLRHGDERAAELAVDLTRCVAELATEHDAEVVKSMGDAVMVRASDAALAMKLALRVVAELDPRRFPPVRVGVHTGPAVRHDDDWYGATVNLTARLCDAARPGEVLVSEVTRRAAATLLDVRLRARRVARLKNVGEPSPLYAAAAA